MNFTQTPVSKSLIDSVSNILEKQDDVDVPWKGDSTPHKNDVVVGRKGYGGAKAAALAKAALAKQVETSKKELFPGTLDKLKSLNIRKEEIDPSVKTTDALQGPVSGGRDNAFRKPKVKFHPGPVSTNLAKEEVEPLDEISKKTLGRYLKKATDTYSDNSMITLASKAAFKLHSPYAGYGDDDGEADDMKAVKRSKGVARAIDRLTKEETEQLDELTKKTLGRYLKKAHVSGVGAATSEVDALNYIQQSNGTAKESAKRFVKKVRRKGALRQRGITRAVDRLTKEETNVLKTGPMTRMTYGNKVLYDKKKGINTDRRAHKNVKVGQGADAVKEETEQLDEIHTLRFVPLTDTHREHIIKSINSYGSGQHPSPDSRTLPDFSSKYAHQCVQKAVKKGHPCGETAEHLKKHLKEETSLDAGVNESVSKSRTTQDVVRHLAKHKVFGVQNKDVELYSGNNAIASHRGLTSSKHYGQHFSIHSDGKVLMHPSYDGALKAIKDFAKPSKEKVVAEGNYERSADLDWHANISKAPKKGPQDTHVIKNSAGEAQSYHPSEKHALAHHAATGSNSGHKIHKITPRLAPQVAKRSVGLLGKLKRGLGLGEDVNLEEGIVDHEAMAKELIKQHGTKTSLKHIDDMINQSDEPHKIDPSEVKYHVDKLSNQMRMKDWHKSQAEIDASVSPLKSMIKSSKKFQDAAATGNPRHFAKEEVELVEYNSFKAGDKVTVDSIVGKKTGVVRKVYKGSTGVDHIVVKHDENKILASYPLHKVALTSGIKKAKLNMEDLDEEITRDHGGAYDLDTAKKIAHQESKNGYAQHVEKNIDHNGKHNGTYAVRDWYDGDHTVASYENGRDLSR